MSKSFLYFLIWQLKAAKSENKKGFSMSEKARINDDPENFFFYNIFFCPTA